MEALTIKTEPQYDVLFDSNILARAGELSAKHLRGRNVLIITDDNVAPLYLNTVKCAFESASFAIQSYVVPSGEASKSLAVVEKILNYAVECGLTRIDAMIALGGGVVGDLTGLCAALYMRGIDFIQMPTTLLAMVDSSVGGKTAVNLPAGKNLCGAFYQPKLVICDVDTLNTLEKPVFAEGMAEIIKHGAICSTWVLDAVANGCDMAELIRANVGIKGDIVAKDERESDLRQLLNLGHTFGHAIEALNDFKIYHGEGVAVGLIIASYTAQQHGLCEQGVYEELKALLQKYDLPISTPFSYQDVARHAMSDKKKKGAKLTLVLPQSRGKSVLYPIDADALYDFISVCEGVVTGV